MSQYLNVPNKNLIFPKILEQSNNSTYNIIQYIPQKYEHNFSTSVNKVVNLQNVLKNGSWIPLDENSKNIAYAHVFSLYNNNYIVYDIDNIEANLRSLIVNIKNDIHIRSIKDKNIDSYRICLSSTQLIKRKNTYNIHVYIGLNKFMDVAKYYNSIPFNTIMMPVCGGFIRTINIKQKVSIRISPIINNYNKCKNTNIIILMEGRKENESWTEKLYSEQIAHSETSDGVYVKSNEKTVQNFQSLIRG